MTCWRRIRPLHSCRELAQVLNAIDAVVKLETQRVNLKSGETIRRRRTTACLLVEERNQLNLHKTCEMHRRNLSLSASSPGCSETQPDNK